MEVTIQAYKTLTLTNKKKKEVILKNGFIVSLDTVKNDTNKVNKTLCKKIITTPLFNNKSIFELQAPIFLEALDSNFYKKDWLHYVLIHFNTSAAHFFDQKLQFTLENYNNYKSPTKPSDEDINTYNWLWKMEKELNFYLKSSLPKNISKNKNVYMRDMLNDYDISIEDESNEIISILTEVKIIKSTGLLEIKTTIK